MVNIDYAYTHKIPLSPYSMFTIYLPGISRREHDLPVPAQFRLVRTVLVGGDLIGERGGDLGYGYNPFELYGMAKNSRNQPLPPHLLFASLESAVAEDACAFLDAYGPLEGINECEVLAGDSLKEWEKASLQSTPPEEYFRSTLEEVPLLPPPPISQGDFHRYSLKRFWKAQSQFKLTVRLSSALSSTTHQLANIHRALNSAGRNWNIKGPNAERSYIKHAREFVLNTVNSNLERMEPRLTIVLGSENGIAGAWPCYSLLEAMYLMLFLDIASRGVRIAQCEKCSKLFYTDREKGKYCSPICENRARALRAYYRRR